MPLFFGMSAVVIARVLTVLIAKATQNALPKNLVPLKTVFAQKLLAAMEIKVNVAKKKKENAVNTVSPKASVVKAIKENAPKMKNVLRNVKKQTARTTRR
ncbi:MAG: hypothetical protein HOK65_10445 [Crocinitomicaceae bacterium]|nr:hypothetical protein [Crocinitomicaceae bacterium]